MGIRISEMEEATTFGADDYVPIVTNGTNKKALGAKIKNFIAGFFVSKSGDTMSGNLTVEKSNGEFGLKNPNVTINTTANNGVTSSQIEGVIVKDSVDNNVARFLALQETNGDVIAQIAAFNKKTDGTATNNYINATIKKDGTRTYSIADPAAFRQAIGIKSVVFEQKSKTTGLPTFAANSANSLSIDVSKSGYIAMGTVVITGSSTTGLVIQEYYIDDNQNIRIYFRNATNSPITPTRITVVIVYIEN